MVHVASSPADISLFRLYVLRGAYALITVGLVLMIWPRLLGHSSDWPHMNSVVGAMLGAVSLLAALGIRYPLQMLPVLLFELVWKTIWLVAVALPLWRSDQLGDAHVESVKDCVFGVVVVVIAMPWRYFFANYVARHGDRWRR